MTEDKRYQVRMGGLMRCCLASLDEQLYRQPVPGKEGDVIRCKSCRSPMIFKDSAWEWHRIIPEEKE